MNKKPPFLFLLFTILVACSTKLPAQKEINFPDDFVLQENEMPEGFIIRPMDDNARKLGLPDNPGVLTDQNFYGSMYPDADVTTIKQMLIAIYSKPEAPDKELGTFVVEFYDKEMLKREVKNVIPGKEMIYFTKGNYMVLVWSDGGLYVDEVREAADHLKKRLKLKEVK